MKTREQQQLLTAYARNYEAFALGRIDSRRYYEENIKNTEQLILHFPEQPIYQLMKANVFLHAGELEKAEKLLKKYEKNPILQLKNQEFRAYFLYLAACLSEDLLHRRQILGQLQKIFRKNPEEKGIYYYLVKLDETFERNPEKKIKFLEKQWKSGNNQNYLYLETLLTLQKYPELLTEWSTFFVQICVWGIRKQLLPKELGPQLAKTALSLKKKGYKYEYLLCKCYEYFSTKEFLTAVCCYFMGECRTDSKAAGFYERGIEFQLKITNLNEYYMMSTVEKCDHLLPEQVLLHFLYHDTLYSSQKVFLYHNIVKYGKDKSEIYEKYRQQMEDYVVESLLKRRISQEYGYLYETMLHLENFTEEMASAMADLMFLRKLECKDLRIREVKISYEELEEEIRIPLRRGKAFVPIYTPHAKITLLDECGNLYRNTISYDLIQIFEFKTYLPVCRKYVKNHSGLLLYLCEGKGGNRLITEKNLEYLCQIPDTKGFTENYRNTIMLEVMEFLRKENREAQIPESWFICDGFSMTRQQRAKYLDFLLGKKQYENAYAWIRQYGTAYVSAKKVLEVLTHMTKTQEAESELYYRLCYGCFQNGQMANEILKYLSERFLGTCRQMTEVWKQARAYGLNTKDLEERILTQMIFTETMVEEHFSIFTSYYQRNPEDLVTKAYFSYCSREVLRQQVQIDSCFFFLLEEHLMKSWGGNDVCKLAYLKNLSQQTMISVQQKKLAGTFLKEFLCRRIYFSFMQKFADVVPETLMLEDKVFVEYYAEPGTKAVLHYAIEKKDSQRTMTRSCSLYPMYGGICTMAFSMMAGEKLTYFIEEIRGEERKTTESQTIEKPEAVWKTLTRYGRLNEIQEIEMEKKEQIQEKMEEFAYLDLAAEKLFPLK